jgi:hypothetical protein
VGRDPQDILQPAENRWLALQNKSSGYVSEVSFETSTAGS